MFKIFGFVIIVGLVLRIFSGKKYGFFVFLMDVCNMLIYFLKLKDDN